VPRSHWDRRLCCGRPFKDRLGQVATDTWVVEGVNAAPTLKLLFTCLADDYPAGTSTGLCLPTQQPNCPPIYAGAYVECLSGVLGPFYDDEGDRIYCDEVEAEGFGCLSQSFNECGSGGAMGSSASFDFGAPARSTECTYRAYMYDGWGARSEVGTMRFPVWAK
jgi:hypothetical protein